MYRNYVFDFYGTLADIRTDEENLQLWEKMSEIYAALGAPYKAEELKSAFRRMENGEVNRLKREHWKRRGYEKSGRSEASQAEKDTIKTGQAEANAPEADRQEMCRAETGEPEADRPKMCWAETDKTEADRPKMCRAETDKTESDRPEMCRAETGAPESDRPEIYQAEEENAEPDLTKVFAMLYHEKNAPCDAAQARMTAITFRALSRRFLRLYDGVEELLGELRRRGRKIYLLSNAQSDFTRPEIEMLGLTHYFDGIVLSSEQGCKKPSPVFFRRLLERYGLKPSESIMIGNDETADIAGARSVGMDTLYIHTDISPEEYGKVPATYRVMDGDFRKTAQLLLDADARS